MMTAAPSLACMAATAARRSSLSSGFFDSSAAVGHTVAQVPQPTQRSGATAKSLPSTRMAPVGHASAQRRQEALRLRTTTHRLGCTASDWLSSFSKSPRMLSMDILPLWVNWHNEIRPPLRASRVAPRYPCQRSKRAESLRSWWFLPQIIVPKPTAQYGENTPLCQREGGAKSARQSGFLRLSHPTASPLSGPTSPETIRKSPSTPTSSPQAGRRRGTRAARRRERRPEGAPRPRRNGDPGSWKARP